MSQFTKYCEPIPTWALCYIINGDATGLTDEEIVMVDSWVKDSGYEIITPCEDEKGEFFNSFCSCPAFGAPCDCTECWCMVRENN